MGIKWVVESALQVNAIVNGNIPMEAFKYAKAKVYVMRKMLPRRY